MRILALLYYHVAAITIGLRIIENVKPWHASCAGRPRDYDNQLFNKRYGIFRLGVCAILYRVLYLESILVCEGKYQMRPLARPSRKREVTVWPVRLYGTGPARNGLPTGLTETSTNTNPCRFLMRQCFSIGQLQTEV